MDEGLVRGIGLSNCSTAQVEAVLKAAKHKPLVNQVRCQMRPAKRPACGRPRRQLARRWVLLCAFGGAWQRA